MYQRTIKLYRGIDNVIRFTFKNADQQKVNITGFNVTFNLLSDVEGTLLISKQATIVDAPKGVASVTVNELELLDLTDQYYSYSLYVTDVDTGEKIIVYAGQDFSVRGTVQVLAGHYPEFKDSINVDLPAITGGSITTGVVKSDSPTMQNSSHHTAQFNLSEFTGEIKIQSTLESLPNPSFWATEATITLTNKDTPIYYNWDGVFAGIRFVITPVTGSVTKILYRA